MYICYLLFVIYVICFFITNCVGEDAKDFLKDNLSFVKHQSGVYH